MVDDTAPATATTEDALAQIVCELAAAEATAKRLRRLMIEHGRALAKERGVAFIREERLRQEFA